MQTRFVALLGLLVASSVALAGTSTKVLTLIEVLGNDDFEQRERASELLRAIGPKCLPALQHARTHEDAEVRQRVAELIEEFETHLERTQLTSARRYSLSYVNKPVLEVIADISKVTGLKLVFTGDKEKAKSKLTTLEAKNATCWEVLAKLCRQGLEEYRPETRPDRSKMGDILLRLGTPKRVPTALVGPFRIRVLPARSAWPVHTPKEYRRRIELEVRADPEIGLKKLLAIRERGATTKTARLRTDFVADNPASDSNLDPRVQELVELLMEAEPTPTGNALLSSLSVHSNGRRIRTLDKLSGTLVLEMMTPPQPLAEVETKASILHRVLPTRGGGTIRVSEMKEDEDGFWNFRVTVVRPLTPEVRAGVLNAVQLQKMCVHVGQPIERKKPAFQLLDAEGEPIRFATGACDADANGTTLDYKFSFLPKRGQKPAKLIYLGKRPTVLEVPFAIEGVRLD